MYVPAYNRFQRRSTIFVGCLHNAIRDVAILGDAITGALNTGRRLDGHLHRDLADAYTLVCLIEELLDRCAVAEVDAESAKPFAEYLTTAHGLAVRLERTVARPRFRGLMWMYANISSGQTVSDLVTMVSRARAASKDLPRLLRFVSEAEAERRPATPLAAGHGTTRYPGQELLTQLVVALATCVLPGGHRSRYREEFLAELADHPSWFRRMGYAARVTCTVWRLRFSLSNRAATTTAGRGSS